MENQLHNQTYPKQTQSTTTIITLPTQDGFWKEWNTDIGGDGKVDTVNMTLVEYVWHALVNLMAFQVYFWIGSCLVFSSSHFSFPYLPL